MVMMTAPPSKEAFTDPTGGLKLKTAAEQRELASAAQTSQATTVLVRNAAKAPVLRRMIRDLWIWHFTGKIPVLWLETNT
jgi:hypothetical protein